jgi:hypothetical protein
MKLRNGEGREREQEALEQEMVAIHLYLRVSNCIVLAGET